jgi:hypothetical protein
MISSWLAPLSRPRLAWFTICGLTLLSKIWGCSIISLVLRLLLSPRGLFLHTQKYALELLRRASMLQCHTMLTPMTSNERLTSSDGELLSSEDATTYHSIVGGLQYLMHTRPNLSFVVNKVYQYLHAPRSPHWSVVKRILRYVQHTISHGLHIHVDSSSLLSAFFDADWEVTLMIGDPRGQCHILWSWPDRLEYSGTCYSFSL